MLVLKAKIIIKFSECYIVRGVHNSLWEMIPWHANTQCMDVGVKDIKKITASVIRKLN